MKILVLSPYPERLGLGVTATAEPITPEIAAEFDLLISYGYRHILRRPVLDALRRPAINLHIALLPYNRGAHPNYWSWAEGTPPGVTIHEIDAGVDTGPIIAQRMPCLADTLTFRQSYDLLQREIESLFAASWPAIRDHAYRAYPQCSGSGTSHRARDLPTWPGGWDARICDVCPRS